MKNNPTLKDPPGRDDLLYMTAIPWVSFTSFVHPMRLHPADYVPRFAWGKYFEEGKRLKMPLSVQGHHALLDGIHMGKFYGLYRRIPETTGERFCCMNKKIILLFLVIGVFIAMVIFYGPTQSWAWDPSYYYAQLRSPIIDKELDFSR